MSKFEAGEVLPMRTDDPALQPLRLAVGSHEAGSGKGCAMNVISWETGDTEITDFPECADLFLAALVQRVNDKYCTHRDGDLLCPSCSIEVLALAHRTVGTSGRDDSGRVWVRIAAERARSVAAHSSIPWASTALDVVDRWLDGDATHDDLVAAAGSVEAAWATWAANWTLAAVRSTRAAKAAASAAAWTAMADEAIDVALAAEWAAKWSVEAAAWAVEAVEAAASAASYERVGTTAAERSGHLIRAAHEVIDRFEELTGFKAVEPDPAAVLGACNKMLATTGASS